MKPKKRFRPLRGRNRFLGFDFFHAHLLNLILVDAFDAILDSGEDYIEIPEASIAIAPAEVVAALLGRAATSLPEAVMEWVEGQGEVHSAVISKARSAVDRVLADSELQGVWEDSGNNRWKLNVEDLLRRLA